MDRIVLGGLRVKAIDKPLELAVGFFFGNTELSLELWEFISVVARFDSHKVAIV